MWLKRIKNLLAWSKIDPRTNPELVEKLGKKHIDQPVELAQVIKRPKDIIEELNEDNPVR